MIPTLIVLLALAASAYSADVFVSNSGDDSKGKGTIQRPFKTLKWADWVAKPGDTILLRGGVYDGVTVTTDDITIRPYQTEKVVLYSSHRSSRRSATLFLRSSGTTAENLEVVGGYHYAIQIDGSGVTVRNCDIHDSGRDCVKVAPGTTDTLIENCTIHDSGRRDRSNAEGIDNVRGHEMIVRNCHIYNTATCGIYMKLGATRCVIESNLVENCGASGISLGYGGDAYWLDRKNNPGEYECIDGVARYNVVVNTKNAGIEAISALRPVIHNNTLVEVARYSRAGIHFAAVDHGPKTRVVLCRDAQVYNNIVIASARAGRPVFYLMDDSYANLPVSFNNVYYCYGGPVRLKNSQVWPQFFGPLSEWQSRFGLEADSVVLDPKLDQNYVPTGFHRPGVGAR